METKKNVISIKNLVKQFPVGGDYFTALQQVDLKLTEGEFTGPVNGDMQMQLAFRSPHLSDINMEVANWIRLEFLFVRLVTRHLWQTGYAMALKAAVQ